MLPRLRSILDRFTFRSDWRADIMRQFEHPKSFPLVITPADFSYARARLSAFRSDVEWLVVFETFGFDSEGNFCEDRVFAYGNKLRRDRQLAWGPEINPVDEDGNYLLKFGSPELLQILDPTDFWLEIDGVMCNFTPTPTDYAELGMSLSDDISTNDVGVAAIRLLTKTLRYVAYRFPELVFCQPRKLLENLDRPETLSLFIQTFDWQHPYWLKDDYPSNNACLQSLAVALADNNVNAFQYAISNTHWSNWPEWPN